MPWNHIRASDRSARVMRIAMVVYLAPAILAVFIVGLIAVALVHAVTLVASMLPHVHRVLIHPVPTSMATRIGGGRVGRPPFA